MSLRPNRDPIPSLTLTLTLTLRRTLAPTLGLALARQRMAAADSGSGAGGEIAGRTSSWCALWAAEGAEGWEGEEGWEGAEEGAARRAIEAAVERAAWLTGLSPAHAEECQVVTPAEPDSHPTPSSRPHPRASLHPPCTRAPPPRARWCTTRPARSTATTSTTSPLRTRASASAWARRHVQAKGH